MNKKEYFIKPFHHQILESFPFIAEDFDQLTEYELYCKLCAKMDEVIAGTNKLEGDVNEYIEKFNALKSYVDNYFDNLDVQDEINNKLDAMATDGTLDQIINQEIFGGITTNIGDLSILTTPDKSSLANAINSNNKVNEVFFGKSLFYDITDDLNNVQGSCINGNNLYVAVQGNGGTTGTIYIFNIVTNSYVGKYEGVLMYHANDMTYINNKLYIASYDSLKICIYDISLNTSTEINPFSSYESNYNHILGVEKITENEIVCWLKPSSGTNSLLNAKFLKLNVNSLEFSEIEINDPYNLAVFQDNIEEQNMCYSNNKIYLLCINPCIIYECLFNNDTITFNHIYNPPTTDLNNNPVGEIESLATINNTNYPAGSIMVTSRGFFKLKNGTKWGEDTIQNYIFSPETGNVYIGDSILGYEMRPSNCYGYFSVSKSTSNLIETGSNTYPYKSLMRAINAANGIYSPCVIQIIDSGTYHVPFLFGVKVRIHINPNCNPTIYFGDIENCDLTIQTVSNGTVKIKPISTASNYQITIAYSDIKLFGSVGNAINFEDVQLNITACSSVRMRRATYNNTIECSSGYAIRISDSSVANLNIANFTIHSNDKLIQLSALGFLSTDINASNIDKSGNVFLISPN